MNLDDLVSTFTETLAATSNLREAVRRVAEFAVVADDDRQVDLFHRWEKRENRRLGAARAHRAAVVAADTRAVAIIRRVSEVTGMPVATLRGPRRFAAVASARRVAYLALHTAGFSLPKIAKLTGRKCHTSVMHGLAIATPVERDQAASVALRERGADAPTADEIATRGLGVAA